MSKVFECDRPECHKLFNEPEGARVLLFTIPYGSSPKGAMVADLCNECWAEFSEFMRRDINKYLPFVAANQVTIAWDEDLTC